MIFAVFAIICALIFTFISGLMASDTEYGGALYFIIVAILLTAVAMNFSYSCGQLSTIQPRCDNCGEEIRTTWIICPYCGTGVEK